MESTTLGPAAPASSRQTLHREDAAARRERSEVSYQDPGTGQAFRLSLDREVSAYAATYDRSGSIGVGPEARNRELRDLHEALRESGIAVQGFRRLLHGLLRAAGTDLPSSLGAALPEGVAFSERVEVLAVSETVTLRMDVVDPAYWSVENTAGRLRDFAVSLYPGGSRAAHVEEMARAMEQGYREAARAFGGTLPDIARQTVDAARALLSEWADRAEEPAPTGVGARGPGLVA